MTKFSQTSQRRITQQDIADAVGVSHVTVSHVLHRSRRSRVSPEMQQEIFRVAHEMGYKPRDVTTHTIAIVVEPGSLWFDVTTNVLMHADEILRSYGYRMSVSTLGMANMMEAGDRFNQKTVDGVLFTEWHPGMDKDLEGLTVPFLLIADTDEAPPAIDQIAMDTVATTAEITRYLLNRGHRFFCVVTGDAGIGIHERMKRGVFETLHTAGLPERNVSVIHDQEIEGQDVEEKLLWIMRQKDAPTAIIAGGPGSALVMLNRLQYNGFRVPDDVSLISVMDSPRLTALKPQIAATDVLGYCHMEMVIQRIIACINRPSTAPERILVPGSIIERNSVRSVRA